MILKEVHIERTDGFAPSRLVEYHALLRDAVFPAVTDLETLDAFHGYGFLSHSHLELRLWFSDDVDLDRMNQILTRHGLPTADRDYNPAETGTEREVLLKMLHYNAETVRALLSAPTQRSIDDAVHWLLNGFGFHNDLEAQWHLRRAGDWYSASIRQLKGIGE